MRYGRLLPVLFCLGTSALAQPVEIDPSDFGKILIAPRQSANGLVYEQAFGDYQNEPVIDYGIDGPAVQLGRPIGRLSLLRDDGTSGLCTAFIVDADHILTNHHCIPGMSGDPTGAVSGVTAARFAAGYIHPGRVGNVDTYDVSTKIIETNRELDYSVLQVFGDPSAKYGKMELVAEDPGNSEFLWIIGHPLGQSQHISREGCAAASPAIEEGKLVHTCDTLGGNSGSPVIRLTDRRVVALHHAGDNLTGFNFAIPMRDILAHSKVLKAALVPDRAQTPDAAAAVGCLSLWSEAKSLGCAGYETYAEACTAHEFAALANRYIAQSCQTEPAIRTLSVKADGTGDHLDLSSAVAAAEAGSRIEIYSGTYDTSVVIDKALDIIGVGDRDDIVVTANDREVIRWTASGGRIENLTIRQTGKEHSAVLFATGSGTLENSDLSSASWAVIGVVNGATPMISSNFIHDSEGVGIYVASGAAAEISTNVIERNGRTGIHVETGSDHKITSNKIQFNGHYGVILTTGAKGLVQDNDISRNEWGGVEVTQGADVVVKGNKIGFNQGPAVIVKSEGRALIEGNSILNNFAAGLILESLHSPVVKNNRISGNLAGAVWVPENGTGIIENNELIGNSGEFIIDDGAGEVIRKDN